MSKVIKVLNVKVPYGNEYEIFRKLHYLLSTDPKYLLKRDIILEEPITLEGDKNPTIRVIFYDCTNEEFSKYKDIIESWAEPLYFYRTYKHI